MASASVISILAEYERNPDWGDDGIHGHVEISIGGHVIIRIPCKYSSTHFEDYPQKACEEVVAAWLGALANMLAFPEGLGF